MNLRIHVIGRNRCAFKNGLAQAFCILTIKRFSLGHHLIEHGPQAVEVRSAIRRVAPYLFRRHVRQERWNAIRNVLRELADAGDAETENLDGTIPPAHDLAWFEAVVNELM